MTAKKAATTAKHTSSAKHKTTSKHSMSKAQAAHLHTLHVAHVAHLAHLAATGKSVTVKAAPAKPAKATKKVAFAVGDWLPVCSFEALAMSLRLAGQRVHGDDVAELWELAGADPEGAGVGEALAAAARFGLAGLRPTYAELQAHRLGEDAHVMLAALPDGRRVLRRMLLDELVGLGQGAFDVHDLILRIDVPGPHAVLATADGWWSWGELHDPWPCTIEAAWAVSWS